MHHRVEGRAKDAVDRRAVAFFEEMLGELARTGGEGGSASLAELFAARLEHEPAMVDYIRRLLLDGGEAADALFVKLFDASVAGMRSLADAGVAQQAQDERIRTAFLLANDLSLVLLHRQIARATGTDPLIREGLVAWTAAVMDVYTGGVFAAPVVSAVPGKQAPGQPTDSGHRNFRPVQELRAVPRRHRPGPGGRAGPGLRVPRAQRGGEDHDHPDAACPSAADQRQGDGSRP